MTFRPIDHGRETVVLEHFPVSVENAGFSFTSLKAFPKLRGYSILRKTKLSSMLSTNESNSGKVFMKGCSDGKTWSLEIATTMSILSMINVN
jgi:hypothetical protein